MRFPRPDMVNAKRIFIQPGEHAVATGEVVLSTLLGSCVAACLYDPVNKIIGMNHFLLASRQFVPDPTSVFSEPGRYGVQAMELLINDMLKLGAAKKYLKAKVFGGGKVLSMVGQENRFSNVGDVNIAFVRQFLEEEKIPLVSSRVGGENGVVIYFFSDDHSVYLRKIGKSQIAKVSEQERQLREKYVARQKERQASVDLWGDES